MAEPMLVIQSDLDVVAVSLCKDLGRIVRVLPPSETEPLCRFELETDDPDQLTVVLGRYAAGDLMVNARAFVVAERTARLLMRAARSGR